MLEKLYRLRWGALDGLGALIISPTRELALQIFNELRKVGKHHDLSAGLLIGGKNVQEERDCVGGKFRLLVSLRSFYTSPLACRDLAIYLCVDRVIYRTSTVEYWQINQNRLLL